MAEPDACILTNLAASWDEEFLVGTKNKNNCSGFVKSVASKLGVPIPATANADGITEYISKNWTKIATGKEAADQAQLGVFVVVALKGANHSPARTSGHVAVVVRGTLYKDKYPLVWGGSTGGAQSKGNKSVGEVWNRSDRDNVAYYAYSGKVCGKP